MSHIPDLVKDSRLETTFVDDFTVHQYDDSDDEGYSRSNQRTEHWQNSELLGRGGCGEVWLQRCVEGKRTYEWRAVKVIATSTSRTKQFDYVSELEAIAKFSQKRVSR
jgi:hypothetical protein